MDKLSLPNMTAEKFIAFTIPTFVHKVMSLLLIMLSRSVKSFLPRSKCLSTSWLQSLPTEILEPKKIKTATVPLVSPSFVIK